MSAKSLSGRNNHCNNHPVGDETAAQSNMFKDMRGREMPEANKWLKFLPNSDEGVNK